MFREGLAKRKGFREMGGLDKVGVIKVGNSTGDTKGFEIGARRKIETRNGLLEEFCRVRGERGVPRDFIGVEGTVATGRSAITLCLVGEGFFNRGEGGGMLRVITCTGGAQ